MQVPGKPRGLQNGVVVAGDPPGLGCPHNGWYVPVAATITGLSEQGPVLPQLLCALPPPLPTPKSRAAHCSQKPRGPAQHPLAQFHPLSLSGCSLPCSPWPAIQGRLCR